MLLWLFCNPAKAGVGDLYTGHYYTYTRAEAYESASGGSVTLLQPGGFDYFQTDWLPPAILLEGPISSESSGVVERLLARIPGIRVIFLDSPGGELFAGMQIGALISRASLMTVVNFSAKCQSACALAFLGGKPRMVMDESNFGFHRQYYIVNGRPEYGSWAKDVRQIAAYLALVGATSVSAEEIVGTTGQVSASQERLKERGITTWTRGEFVVSVTTTAKPLTAYENYKASCHAVEVASLCGSERLLREPAISIFATANREAGQFKDLNLATKGVIALVPVLAKANRSYIFALDCRYTKPSFSWFLQKRMDEIVGPLSPEERPMYEQRRADLEQHCAEVLKTPE